MTDKQFVISGCGIKARAPVLKQLPTRKYYDAVYFHDNQYRHEVANHYRDFQLQRRIRHRRRRINL